MFAYCIPSFYFPMKLDPPCPTNPNHSTMLPLKSLAASYMKLVGYSCLEFVIKLNSNSSIQTGKKKKKSAKIAEQLTLRLKVIN